MQQFHNFFRALLVTTVVVDTMEVDILANTEAVNMAVVASAATDSVVNMETDSAVNMVGIRDNMGVNMAVNMEVVNMAVNMVDEEEVVVDRDLGR